MDCPRCPVAMDPTTAGAVELDVCPRCRSVFFDGGELGRHLGTTREVEEALHHASGRPMGLRCPRCDGALCAVATGEGRVDVCSRCSGLLVDSRAFRAAPGGGVRPARASSSPRPRLSSGSSDVALLGVEVGAEVLIEGGAEALGGVLEMLFEALGELLGGL